MKETLNVNVKWLPIRSSVWPQSNINTDNHHPNCFLMVLPALKSVVQYAHNDYIIPDENNTANEWLRHLRQRWWERVEWVKRWCRRTANVCSPYSNKAGSKSENTLYFFIARFPVLSEAVLTCFSNFICSCNKMVWHVRRQIYTMHGYEWHCMENSRLCSADIRGLLYDFG